MIRNRIGVEDHREWSPAFWWHFPLHFLFQHHPEHAINFVLRLVNFATERWASARALDGEFVLSTTVLIER